MNAVVKPYDEHDQFDPEELDQVALFNALGLDEDEANRLIDVWQRCAPNATLNQFAGALVKGGMALTQDMGD